MIIAVMYATFAVAKRKPEKNSGLYGIRTLDLCDTSAAQRSRGMIAWNTGNEECKRQSLRNGPDKNDSNNGNEHVGMQKRC